MFHISERPSVLLNSSEVKRRTTGGALCWRGNSIPFSPELKPNLPACRQVLF